MENTDTQNQLSFATVPPLEAIKQLFWSWSHVLFNYVYDPLLLTHVMPVRNLLIWPVKHLYVLPVIVLGLAWWRRNIAVIFAVLFTLVTLVPTFALKNYFQARYFYVPTIGASLFLAGCTYPLIIRMKGDGPLASRLAGYCAIILLVIVVAGDVVGFQQQMARTEMRSVFVKQTYEYLKVESANLPADSLIIFEDMPEHFLFNGLGGMEMIELTSGRTDLGATTSASLTERISQEAMLSWPRRYALDVLTTSPQLRRLH